MSEVKKNFHSELEEQVIEFWKKNNTFEKSVEKEAPNGNYVFTDGPPFITGSPHYATLLPSIAKDLIPRYWTMKGYRVRRVWGWDCHGLPAENKVEGELKLKNKKEIEALGVGRFVNACMKYVDKGTEQWKWYINRIGRWADIKNAYKTMNLDFMESVIWTFKELYDKGLIYEGYRSSLHCPRCATPLSKFEITMDTGSYRNVTDQTVTVKFKIINQKKKYLLAWTTTPWTLPGNFALAVGKDVKYIEVELSQDKGSTYILAKDRAEEMLKSKKYKLVKEYTGKDLIGWEYEPLFDLENKDINKSDKVYKVYTADFVSIEEGTGIVHIAQNFGEDDFVFGQENGLPIINIMDEMGVYTDQAGKDWSGLYFKKAGEKAMEELELSDKLFSKFEYTHSYPFCYRCESPLIFRSQKAWYLNIDKIRGQLLQTNKKINWVPEHFKYGRFKYNIENAPDWCLSRSRYWGSPIPVWKCTSCDEIKVVGSVNEIEELGKKKIKDLHRPRIDDIEFKCEKCKSKMRRVKEVIDCWFESGSVPHAQWHYPFEHLDDYQDLSPADYIIEYTGQLRGWFYYLHVLSNCLFDDVSFKNVIVTGVLAGTDGRKMSKSFGNYPDPKEVLNKYGADALRMYFMSSPIMIGGDMNLSEKDIQESLRKNIMMLWNVYKFYSIFGKGSDEEIDIYNSKNVLDRWILVRLHQLLKTVTENLEKYDIPAATRPITDFIDDLSTWYLRLSRDRFKGDDMEDKEIAIAVLKHVLLETAKIIAPVMPFISEQIWQKVTNENFKSENMSVHLEKWPEINKSAIDEKVIENMMLVKELAEQIHSMRDEAGIKLRQPLLLAETKKSIEFKELLAKEVNVLDIKKVNKFSTKAGVISRKEVALDTNLTTELKQAGDLRELVRAINSLRKKAKLTPNDQIELFYQTDNQELQKLIEKNSEKICKLTISKKIIQNISEGNQDIQEVDINNKKLSVLIVK